MVKCADCGYLAQYIYRGSVPQGFIGIEATPRETGELPGNLGWSVRFTPLGEPDVTPDKMSGDRFPTCFSRVFQLGQEVKACYAKTQEAKMDTSFASAVREVIHRDRVCKQFVKWERGFTPKEHREMMDREQMLKWQREERRSDIHWRIIELIVLVVGAGLFTLLGAWIAGK